MKIRIISGSIFGAIDGVNDDGVAKLEGRMSEVSNEMLSILKKYCPIVVNPVEQVRLSIKAERKNFQAAKIKSLSATCFFRMGELVDGFLNIEIRLIGADFELRQLFDDLLKSKDCEIHFDVPQLREVLTVGELVKFKMPLMRYEIRV